MKIPSITVHAISAAIVTIIATMTVATVATAKSINVDAKAGRTTLIYQFSQYNAETCGSMAMPKFKIQSVGNGKIVGTKGSFVLDTGPCAGKRIKGVAFKYTPKGGFRGTDKAKVMLIMPEFTDDTGRSVENLNFRINVK